MRQSNILDPIHETLPPSMFTDPGSTHPRLKPAHRRWIQATVKHALEDEGYTNVDEWLSLVLTGSLTTYQYGHESDVDVSLFVDAEHFPDWSRAEIIGIMISKIDSKTLPGTIYPMQCFVVPPEVSREDLYKPGLRSGYDLHKDGWLEPPDRTRVHDVEREYNDLYIYALEQADKMERLLRYEPEKAKLLWHQIHERRRRDQKAGKGDYSSSNIVYKFLSNRGLFPEIAEATGEYIARVAGTMNWLDNKESDSLPGYQGDHSFVYEPSTQTLNVGGFDRHHADIYDHMGRDWDDPNLTTGAIIGNTLHYYGPWEQAHKDVVRQLVTPHHDSGPYAGEQLEDVDNNGEEHVFGRRLADFNHQGVLDANAGRDLTGLPGPVNVPGTGRLHFHGHNEIQRLSEDYNRTHGIQQTHPTDYMKVRPEISAKIAQAYDQVQHNPEDPLVKASYAALANETRAQYDHAVKAGYNFEFYPQHDPYPNSPREAVLDLHHNKHMYVYPTSAGYGSDDSAPMDHPLLGDSGVKWNGQPVTHNDLFRAVHDFYGHGKEGLGFRADGEDNAYRQHAAMFSPLARKALASETRGQNSWVNYGPHGEANQTAGQGDTVFASQKAGLLPPWAEDTNLHAPVTARTAVVTDKQVAKYAYDPVSNHIVVGQMGRAEGEQLSHYQLMNHAGLAPENCLFGHLEGTGRTESYSRPRIRGFGTSPMNQYEADYRLKQALEHAVPGTHLEAFQPTHDRWDLKAPPQITFTGVPPVVDGHATTTQNEPQEEWVFG